MNRDKFLTEVMGECWHEYPDFYVMPQCCKCLAPHRYAGEHNFSTWEGFGKLWEWSQKQEWWSKLLGSFCYGYSNLLHEQINPDRFADAVYEFLKQRGKG